MRVAFNARILADPILRGWNRYTLNLISNLVELGVDVYLYCHRELDRAQLAQVPVSSLTIRQAPQMNYLYWEQRWIAQQCSADQIDIFHAPVHFGMPQFVRAKCVLTLHDAIDEIYYAPRMARKSMSQRVTSALSYMARHRADHIVTVSEFSRQDLIRYFKIPESRISVTYGAADDRFRRAISLHERKAVRAKYGLREAYLFYIGSLEPRKNLPYLLKAFAVANLPHLQLVVAGGKKSEENELLAMAESLAISHNIRAIGRVADEDLPALYADAQAFVYPSEYEGFGLQICEALAVGCPVLAAHASCLPEVLGNGGETFTLSDPSVLSNQIKRLHVDTHYREALQARARQRANFFSWSQTAKGTLAVYEKLCSVPSNLPVKVLARS